MNKYLYFEQKFYNGETSTIDDKVIQNENFLVNKPHTNSNGIWGVSSLTKWYQFNDESYLNIHQHWVDLEKFNLHGETEFNGVVIKVLNKLNDEK